LGLQSDACGKLRLRRAIFKQKLTQLDAMLFYLEKPILAVVGHIQLVGW
jgi:hypothetical protein